MPKHRGSNGTTGSTDVLDFQQVAKQSLLGGEEEDVDVLVFTPRGGTTASFDSGVTNTLKALIGMGVIALPEAFWQGGWLVSTLSLLVIAALSAYSMSLLILCQRRVREIRENEFSSSSGGGDGDGPPSRRGFSTDSYDPLGLAVGPMPPDDALAAAAPLEVTWREVGDLAAGTVGKHSADVVLIACQTGAACSFAAFMLNSFVSVFAGGEATWLPWVAMMMAPVLIILSGLKSTASLAWTSAIGNVLFFIAFSAVLAFGFLTTPPSFEGVQPTTSLNGFSHCFGVLVFSLSGHAEVMSVEQFLQQQSRRGYLRVLNGSVCCITVLYLVLGLLCSEFFKSSTQSITDFQCSDFQC